MNFPGAVSDDEAEVLLSYEEVSTHSCGMSTPLTNGVETFLQPTDESAKTGDSLAFGVAEDGCHQRDLPAVERSKA